MKISQTLPRPENWSDFEDLCKRLWGEVWECPEIQKHGRLGQNQSGVDVFGMKKGEDGYYGIQCKGKNEYNNNQLTEREIDDEVEAAKHFEPPLKKLYLVTTAQNDVKVQAYVRKLNLKHRAEGLFEVHVFGWESIVGLINENKRTHDFYVKSQNFKRNHAVRVTFHDGSTVLEAPVQFSQTKTIYSTKDNPLNPFLKQWSAFDRIAAMYTQEKDKVNRSYFRLGLRVENTGEYALENYKLRVRFSTGCQKFSDEQPIELRTVESMLAMNFRSPRTWTSSENSEGFFSLNFGHAAMLVPLDGRSSNDLWIRPHPDASEILLDWTFLSKDFNDEGLLRIEVNSEIEKRRKYVKVEVPTEERKEDGEITDYWEEVES